MTDSELNKKRKVILDKLKEKGCRITKQRIMIIDIVLENECSCCKEIYYKAAKMDSHIGIATVYRLVNNLEEIGAINRKNMYKVAYSEKCCMKDVCTIVLDDDTTYHLSAQRWNAIIKAGLTTYGYMKDQNIVSVTVKAFECEDSWS